MPYTIKGLSAIEGRRGHVAHIPSTKCSCHFSNIFRYTVICKITPLGEIAVQQATLCELDALQMKSWRKHDDLGEC